MESRDRLLKEVLTEDSDRDFAFIIRRLHNKHNQLESQMYMLVDDTAIFEEGKPILLVTMNKRPILDVIRFHENPSLILIVKIFETKTITGSYLEQQQLAGESGSSDPIEKSREISSGKLTEELDRQKVDGPKEAAAKLKKERSGWRVYEYKKKSSEGDASRDYPTSLSRENFVELLRTPAIINSYWRDVFMFKRSVFNSEEGLRTVKIRFIKGSLRLTRSGLK